VLVLRHLEVVLGCRNALGIVLPISTLPCLADWLADWIGSTLQTDDFPELDMLHQLVNRTMTLYKWSGEGLHLY